MERVNMKYVVNMKDEAIRDDNSCSEELLELEMQKL